MITAHEPVQKVCQNAIVFPSENVTGFRWEKKPVTPGGPGYFTWVKSDKESSPVVGKFLRSRV